MNKNMQPKSFTPGRPWDIRAWLLLLVWLQTLPLMAQTTTRIGVLFIGEKGQERKAPNIERATVYCQQARIECEIIPLPTTRAFAELEANRIQFVISLDHRPSGMHPIKIAKVETIPIGVVARKSARECSELSTMTLAAFRNVLYARKLAERCPGLRITWANSYSQCMQMYRSGRVDGVVGVAKNFSGKLPSVELKEGDILVPVATDNLWLFGNAQSQHSEAALRLLKILPRL